MRDDSSTTSATAGTSDLGTPVAGSGAGRPWPVQRGHQVTAQFGVWGTQRVDVHASAGGGRGDLSYLAVTVGECLTYVYDREALASHVAAWRDAAAYNQSFRLPPVPPGPRDGAAAGSQELMLVCTVFGGQRHTVTGAASGGVRVLSVVVGAVTVRVHSSEALRCYLLAWNRAQTLAAVLDPPADPLVDLPDGP